MLGCNRFKLAAAPLRAVFAPAMLGLVAASAPVAAADPAAAPPGPPQQPGEVRAAAQGGGLEEIVVTAARRSEDIQRSSLSIQSVDANTLERAGVNRVESLNDVVPGITIANVGGGLQTYIRGVGSFSTDAYAESAVAYNLDGVYISRAWEAVGNFFDLERVEVLKGPQGTLYGRNASGGAVNLITRRPTFQFGADAGVEFGNYGLVRTTGAVNVPLGDNFALRGSWLLSQHDGYYSDGYDDEDLKGGRLHALWKPMDDLSVLLTLSDFRTGGQGPGSTPIPPLTGDHWLGVASAQVVNLIASQSGAFGPPGAALYKPSTDGFNKADVRNVSSEINWQLPFATFTLLPAHRWSDFDYRTYPPGFLVSSHEKNRQTSVEARLSNSSDFLKWVGGAYYFNEDIHENPHYVSQGISDDYRVVDINTKSTAAFGEATVSILERLRGIAGLRYTREDKSQAGSAAISGNAFPLSNDITFDSVTWKGGTEYDLAERSMLFFTASTGFKSGGFYEASSGNTYKPEKLTAFELGSRNRLLDNHLQLNLEAFYWKYTDHQEAHLGPTADGNLTFVVDNAGKATIYGGDLDLQYLLTDVDNFKLSVEYLHPRYDTFTYRYPSGIVGPPVTGCTPGATDGTLQQVDCAGQQMVRAPHWAGSAGYEHKFELGQHGSLSAAVHTEFSSAYWLAIDFIPEERAPGFTRTDLDLTYRPPGERWSISAYVRNIENNDAYTQAFRYPFVTGNPPNPQAASQSGLLLGSNRPPRTFGARFHVSF